MTAEDVAEAAGPREGFRWIFLPLVIHNMGMVLIYTLQLLLPFRLFHLMLDILHKISTLMTNFHLRTRRRKKILTWLREVLPAGQRVRDLTAVWRDGTILCDVIESVVPGSCSEKVRKRHSHKSIQHGQILASRHLSVQPAFTHDELHQVIFSSYLERRFLRYLMHIRCTVLHLEQNNGALSRILRLFRRTQSTAPKRKREPAPPSLGCVVKGMGLVVAVQQRRACFCIHLLQSRYQVSSPGTPIPDIAVRIEGPNSDFGEVTIQQMPFNMSNEQTTNHSQSFINGSNKFPRSIPINYSVTSGCIRISYIPQSPGLHKLSVTMHNEHVPESPYLITVDSNIKYVTECLSFGMSDVKEVSRIRPERRKVLFRKVDFITEHMLLTQEGKLKKLPSDAKVKERPIPRQMAVCFSFGGINSRSESGSNNKNSMEHGIVTDMNRNKRRGLSLVMLPLNGDTNKSTPQTNKLSRRDLDFFRDRCRKVILLCSLLLKRNPSHNIFHMLHSVESILNGRPVRLTEKTFKLIESGMRSIKPEINDNIGESFATEVFGRGVLKLDEILSSTDVTDDCEQNLMKCGDVTSSSHKIATEDKATNKCSKYKAINITRHELTTCPMTERIHFERKPNTCTNNKNTSLYVGANEVISVGKPQNTDISGYYKIVYRTSLAGITTNFTSSTSSTLPSNRPIAFYKPFQFGSDGEVHSYSKTINISTEREQVHEKLGNRNANKQLQTTNKNCKNIDAIEIENFDLNKTEAVGLKGTENGTYRAILVHITDDGYIIPAEQSAQLLTKVKLQPSTSTGKEGST